MLDSIYFVKYPNIYYHLRKLKMKRIFFGNVRSYLFTNDNVM